MGEGATARYTAQDVAAMQRDGFLVVRGLLSDADMSRVSRWVDELVELPEVSGQHWVFHEQSRSRPELRLIQRMEKFCEFHRGLDAFVRRGVLAQWCAGLMGGPVVLFKEKINFKMGGGGGFEAHQDQQAGWSRYAPRFVTAVLTIDPATPENGCLEVEAQRHQAGLLGPEWAPLDPAMLDLKPIPTEPGDVIFLDSFAPHASQPNQTSRPRRILYLTYNLAEHGDQRLRYYEDKHRSYPPDIDRDKSRTYVFRV